MNKVCILLIQLKSGIAMIMSRMELHLNILLPRLVHIMDGESFYIQVVEGMCR